MEVFVDYGRQRSRESYSQQPWQNCIHPWNVLAHASPTVDCDWFLSGEVADIHMRTDAKKLFRKYSGSCSHSDSELFVKLFDKVIGEGRQLDHRRKNKEIMRSWRSPKHQDTHGAWGFSFHFVYNIHAHKGEKCFFLNTLKVSLSPASRFRESRCYGNNVCTRRLTHLFIHEDHDIVHVHGCEIHFSQCLTFHFSQCCDSVDDKDLWFLQNVSVGEKLCWTRWAHRELLFWVFGFLQA